MTETTTPEAIAPETVETEPATDTGIGAMAMTITQREWLLICRALEEPKDEVLNRTELLMPAIAWVHEKRAHGGADWDRILDMTDPQILELLGVDVDAETDTEAVTAPFVETASSGNGVLTAPPSASEPVFVTTTTTT